MTMNLRRQRFVENYVESGNATQSYIDAGYSENGAAQSADRLLRNADIQQEIAEFRARTSERVELSIEWVLSSLIDIVQQCTRAVPVLDKKGNPTGEYQFNARDAVAALKLLGQHQGMFSTKVLFSTMAEEAARVAEAEGLDAAKIQAEADRILAEKRRA